MAYRVKGSNWTSWPCNSSISFIRGYFLVSFVWLWQMGASSDNVDNVTGFILAVSSSIFIGSSFIIKKMGLKKAGATGKRAGSWFLSCFFFSFSHDKCWIIIFSILIFVFVWPASGGHAYLYEPFWWFGMISSKWISVFLNYFTSAFTGVMYRVIFLTATHA